MPEDDPVITRRATESMGLRIRRHRRRQGMTQAELAAASGVNQGYISQIERDQVEPRRRTIDALAVALGLPQGVLIGGGTEHDTPQPLETRELPLLGTIPAGPPAESQEQLEMFPVLRHQWSADHYCLKLSFDSMEPTLKPGDIVLVHYRPDVDPEHVQGRICACLVDGQPTLKRLSVEHQPDGGRLIILRGDNPRIEPVLITEDHDFSIQGIVLKLVSREL
jgi:SOS-response transcriptional repressor LexA